MPSIRPTVFFTQISESSPAFLESNHFLSSYEVIPLSPRWINSLFRNGHRKWRNIALGTRFAELVLILRMWSSNCVSTFLCEIQANVLAISCMRKVHSVDLPSNVGELGFRGSCLDDSSVGPYFSLFRTYLFAKWWSLTWNWVLSSDCTSVIASGVHSQWCDLQQLLQFKF